VSGRSDAGARRSLCIGHRTGEASLIRGAVHGVMMLCPSFHTVKCQTRYNSFVTFLPQVAGAGRLADGGAAAEVQQLQRAAAAHDSGAASHSPRQPRPRGDHPPRLFWLRLEKPLPEPFTGCPRGSWVPQCCALAPAASSLLCVWALARHRSGNNRSAAEDPRRMPRESVVPQCGPTSVTCAGRAVDRPWRHPTRRLDASPRRRRQQRVWVVAAAARQLLPASGEKTLVHVHNRTCDPLTSSVQPRPHLSSRTGCAGQQGAPREPIRSLNLLCQMSILQGSLGNGGLPPLSAAVLERHGRGAVGLPPIAPLLPHVRPFNPHRIDASSEAILLCLGRSVPLWAVAHTRTGRH